MTGFYNLKVKHTKTLINGLAKSIIFELPAAEKQTFNWKAGQHLTLRFNIDGQGFRRCYSISSSPWSGDPLSITVKRHTNGLISNHVNDNVNVGDEIEVMPPFGSFFLEPSERHRRTYYFFAAGSGITPIYSMLHSILCVEPHSVVYLVYGNKNEQSIIFKEQLEHLTQQHDLRLAVLHVLSDSSMWSSFKPWRTGKIDEPTVKALIDEFPPYAQDTHYYICGPAGMNQSVNTILMNRDVPGERIHRESYGGDIEIDHSIQGVAAQACINLNNNTYTIEINKNQTILEAAIKAGISAPFSCQSGVCGACRATLNQGRVHMRTRMALDDNEIEKGAILTCQSIATENHLKINYDAAGDN